MVSSGSHYISSGSHYILPYGKLYILPPTTVGKLVFLRISNSSHYILPYIRIRVSTKAVFQIFLYFRIHLIGCPPTGCLLQNPPPEGDWWARASRARLLHFAMFLLLFTRNTPKNRRRASRAGLFTSESTSWQRPEPKSYFRSRLSEVTAYTLVSIQILHESTE